MNLKYQLLVAAAALCLGACSTDDTDTGAQPEKGGYKFSFTVAEDSETRTTLSETDVMKWVPEDKVGIYTVGQQNSNSNILTVADVNQSPVEFIGVLEKKALGGDMFYAYYPYDAEQSTDPTSVNLSIPAEQTQTAAGEYNGQSHPLVAVPMEFEWENASYAGRINSARFRLLGAIVELQIYSSPTGERLRGEKIQSVKFVSEKPVAGDFTFDLTSVTVKGELPITGYALTEVTTTLTEPADIPATKEAAALVYLTIAPGEYSGDFVVTTNEAQYTFSLAEPMTFGRAVIKGLPADLAEAEQKPLYAETDPIQFDDPAVKAICVAQENNWDTSGDGELSYGEAAAVTSIGTKFQRKSISSFDELQYFTGLQSIGSEAFYYCSSLTSITIPDGVTEIGSFAFMNCSSLTSITIPAGVTSIGDAVFQSCKKLTNIQLQDGLNSIGNSAFKSCTSLESINIPQTVTTIGSSVFNNCNSLAAFEGENASDDRLCLILNGTLLAFAKAGLTEAEAAYTIPDRVTAIGEYVFEGCSNLTSITIPDTVTAIGTYAFNGCSNLTSITIPNTVTKIENSAFNGCSSLTSITIPDGVKEIAGYTFSYCSGLKSITIPDRVTLIGYCAFLNCSSLTSITIPDAVTQIDDYAFKNCSKLTRVYCKPTNPPTLGKSVFSGLSLSIKICVPAASVETYKTTTGWSEYADQIVANENDPIIFADTAVKAICVEWWDTNHDGELSYKEAANVTSLKPEKGVLFMLNKSISSFNELQYFTGLTSIGGYAFDGCSGLTSITIPGTVTSIGECAFRHCERLTSITIPDQVTSIEDFAFSNCSALERVHCKPATPPTLGNDVFSYTPDNITIYVSDPWAYSEWGENGLEISAYNN